MLSLRECVVEPVERYSMIDQSVAAIPLHYSDVALLKSLWIYHHWPYLINFLRRFHCIFGIKSYICPWSFLRDMLQFLKKPMHSMYYFQLDMIFWCKRYFKCIQFLNPMESKFRKDYTGIYKNVYEDTDSRIRSWINLFWVWKGSVIKLLWQDLLAFLIIYFSLSILYWQVLFYDEASAQYFEMICIYCER